MSDFREFRLVASVVAIVSCATLLAAGAGCRSSKSAKHKAAGNLLFQQQKYGEARAEYEKAVTAEPGDPGSHILLGNALFELEDFAEARAAYEKALALDAKAMEAHRGLAIVIARTAAPGDRKAFDEFLTHIQAVIDANPSDRNAIVSAAQVLSERANPADQGQYLEAQKRAEGYLRDALKQDDRDPKTLFQLALVYARKNDPPTALRVVERLASVSSNPGHGPYAEAVVQTILGHPDDALRAIDRLLHLDVIDPETLKKDTLLRPIANDPRLQAMVDDAKGRWKGPK
jgi:tetratricopeptide (TPR) repeat protein